MRHSMVVALAAVFALAGCSKWNVIQEKDSGAMNGQESFVLHPLSFDAAQIDGERAPQWLAAQDAEQKAAWPIEKDYIWQAFRKTVEQNVGDLKLTSKENPGAATIVLKPSVTELETGGYRKTIMTVGLQVIDPQGVVLEEISTTVKGSRRDEFKVRLAAAAEAAAENVAKYLRKRSGK